MWRFKKKKEISEKQLDQDLILQTGILQKLLKFLDFTADPLDNTLLKHPEGHWNLLQKNHF